MALWLKNEVKLNHAVAVQGRDNCAESSSHCVARDRLSESGPFAKYFCFFPEKNVALNELMAVVLALSRPPKLNLTSEPPALACRTSTVPVYRTSTGLASRTWRAPASRTSTALASRTFCRQTQATITHLLSDSLAHFSCF